MRFTHDAASVRTPLTVVRLGGRDEPDFRVTEGGQNYGVEVAQTTTRQLQSATSRLMQSDSEICMELGPELNIEHDDIGSDPGEWLRTKGERFISEGWIGMEPELQWADICMQTIRKKLAKLRDSYSKSYSLCDLLLYSNTRTPLVDLAAAVQFLNSRAATSPDIAETAISFRSVTVVAENWVVLDALGEKPKIATKKGMAFGRVTFVRIGNSPYGWNPMKLLHNENQTLGKI